MFKLPRRFGWLPDYPDLRDYTAENENVLPLVERLGLQKTKKGSLPEKVDLRKHCSPIENQGEIGSCTANAAAGIIEYYERKAFEKDIDVSRLFIYKTTRNLLHLNGDTGAYIRTTIGSLALFGVPPESYWQYTDKSPDFDKEPPAFCYAFAQNYQALKYYSLDPSVLDEKEILQNIKVHLASGIPVIFGFTVYSSLNQAENGNIPFPSKGETVLGGHAVVSAGYDDKKEIINPLSKEKTTGALLIRNSWGEEWGEKGYGWLPYKYVLKELAIDFWVLLKMEYLDTDQFGLK